MIAAREHLFPRLRARLAESLGGYGSLAGYAEELDDRLGPPGLVARAGPLGALRLASARYAPEKGLRLALEG